MDLVNVADLGRGGLGAVLETAPAKVSAHSVQFMVGSVTAKSSINISKDTSDDAKGAIKIVLVLGQLLVLRLRGVRIFWTAHNLTDHEHASPRLNRFVTAGVIRLAHRIIAHGPTAQRQAQQPDQRSRGKH